ncbi:MAG: transposase [Leptothrix ochracea]
MARLPRLSIPDWPHHVVQCGHDRQVIFHDDEDRKAYLMALREGAATLRMAVHAYALLDREVHLLITPPSAQALGQLMQAIGRRYVTAFNRRHGRTGTLWEGRYRTTIIDHGADTLTAMRYIEQAPVRAGLSAVAAGWTWSSAAHHLGHARDSLLLDVPAFWFLGNTPFDRQAAWLRSLEDFLPAEVVERMTHSVMHGWPQGSGAFLASLARYTERPLSPRPQGRPRRTA